MSLASESSYDAVPYQPNPFPQSQPDRLAVVARLFGMQPALPSKANVLELGGASGDNLIPLAARYPDATLHGFDFSSRQISAAQAQIAALAPRNIRIETGDIATFSPPEKSRLHHLSRGLQLGARSNPRGDPAQVPRCAERTRRCLRRLQHLSGLALAPSGARSDACSTLALTLNGLLELQMQPVEFASVARARPLAFALARQQAGAGNSTATNRRHEPVPLNPFQVALLAMTDGELSRGEIEKVLTQRCVAGDIRLQRDGVALNDSARLAALCPAWLRKIYAYWNQRRYCNGYRSVSALTICLVFLGLALRLGMRPSIDATS